MLPVRRDISFLLMGDLILLGFSLWLALTVRAFQVPSMAYFYEHLQVFVFVFIISILTFFVAGLYEKQARLVKRIIGFRILGVQIANTLIAVVLFFTLPVDIAPKTILGLYLLISVLLISVWRFFVVPRVFVTGRDKAVLIGTGPEVRELFQEVRGHEKYYFELVEHIDTHDVPAADIVPRVKAAIANGVSIVIVDQADERVRGVLSSLYGTLVAGVTLVEFALLYEEIFDRIAISHIDQTWLLEHLPERRVMYDSLKRAFDLVGATIGIVFAIPIILPMAFILGRAGAQPFIFHERIGKRGEVFKIIKLRTMLFDDHGDPELQKRNRVTRIGKILRQTRIDELPQLINVFLGELSFVGPRPELPSIAAVYKKEIPFYDARHFVTPGLSGWAQIYDFDVPRGPADIERTRRKLSYDLYYLKHRSPSLDIAIALKTLRALLSFSGS